MESRTLPLASRRILVVDDQASIRGVLETALSDAGAEVLSAEDGRSALALLEGSLPDVILLDLVMPGMNGWDVIQALSSSPRLSGIPVVLQTSAEDFQSFDQAKRRGVAAFLSKPFRLNEVVETCRRILEGARPLQGRPGRQVPPGQTVQVRDPDENLLSVGHVLDADESGAQVDLESPLPLGQRVVLSYPEAGALVTRTGQVRWVTKAGSRYHHGLSFQRG